MTAPDAADGVPPQARGVPGRRWLRGWRLGCIFWSVILAAVCATLYPAVQNAREAARRSECKGDLFYLGFALRNYHERYNCFPPPYIADADGRPMHSWRVLLLPFMDKADVFNEYRFDEPWDGPNNRKLGARITYSEIHSPFHCYSDEPASGRPDPLMTSYLAVVGPDMAWQDGKCMTLAEITDDHDSTLLLVEVANSGVHWTEPRDLYILQMAPAINPNAGTINGTGPYTTATLSTI